jgi:hypothetical protein
MKLVASIPLAHRPQGVVRPSTGEILLHRTGQWGTYLEAYDQDLKPMWSALLNRHALDVLLDGDGTPWVLDPAGVSALGKRGACVSRVEARVPTGMHVSAFAWVDDGLIFACQHDGRSRMLPPVLERVSMDGKVDWETALPDPLTQVWSRATWTPRTWLSTSRTLDVSGDAVLACFSDMPASGIGCGYVLSLTDGALRFTTQRGPLDATAALGGGAFLVGYQGYGVFETLRYGRDGFVQTRWASHGHYIPARDELRVIEMENVLPSQMHLARLLADGSVTRGARLDGYYTSPPCLRPDGTALFVRKGTLIAARDVAIDDRVELCAVDDRILSTQIAAAGESAYVALWGRADAVRPRLVRVDR